eukprot:6512155-Pyramimonas_sp.AAC.3
MGGHANDRRVDHQLCALLQTTGPAHLIQTQPGLHGHPGFHESTLLRIQQQGPRGCHIGHTNVESSIPATVTSIVWAQPAHCAAREPLAQPPPTNHGNYRPKSGPRSRCGISSTGTASTPNGNRVGQRYAARPTDEPPRREAARGRAEEVGRELAQR